MPVSVDLPRFNKRPPRELLQRLAADYLRAFDLRSSDRLAAMDWPHRTPVALHARAWLPYVYWAGSGRYAKRITWLDRLLGRAPHHHRKAGT